MGPRHWRRCRRRRRRTRRRPPAAPARAPAEIYLHRAGRVSRDALRSRGLLHPGRGRRTGMSTAGDLPKTRRPTAASAASKMSPPGPQPQVVSVRCCDVTCDCSTRAEEDSTLCSQQRLLARLGDSKMAQFQNACPQPSLPTSSSPTSSSSSTAQAAGRRPKQQEAAGKSPREPRGDGAGRVL